MKSFKTHKPCIGCRKKTDGGNCLHHVKSRGSGGGNEAFNLMPLCFSCHELIHRGMNKFVSKRRGVESWLLENGWNFCVTRGKWIRSKDDQ